MHTQSNPQQPENTATTAELHEGTATPSDVASTEATVESKPPTAKKSEAKTPWLQRGKTTSAGTEKPAAKNSQTARPADKARTTASTPTAPSRGPREGSTIWAILQVLDGATAPLSVKDIYAEITKRKLASGLKGKTPDQTVAAALAVAAKKGQYVERAAPGKFELLKERS